MPALPPSSDFNGATVTEGQQKVFVAALRDYLSGLFGADGTVPTALSALGALVSGHSLRSSAAPVTTADRGRLIVATGTWTMALPAAATAGAGFGFLVSNGGSGTITLDPSGSETIDGAATLALGAGRSGLVVCTGSAWLTLGFSGAAGAGLLAADGGLGAPGLAFASDSDTGLHRPGSNQLAVVTGGVRRMLVGSTAITLDLALSGGEAAFQRGTGMDALEAVVDNVTQDLSSAPALKGNLGLVSQNASGLRGLGAIANLLYLTGIGEGRRRTAIANVQAHATDWWRLALIFCTYNGGTAASDAFDERMRIQPNGDVGIATAAPSTTLHVAGPVRCGSYTVATVPSAPAVGAGTQIFVSNESGGAVMAFSDGTTWRRVTDRAAIS